MFYALTGKITGGSEFAVKPITKKGSAVALVTVLSILSPWCHLLIVLSVLPMVLLDSMLSKQISLHGSSS